MKKSLKERIVGYEAENRLLNGWKLVRDPDNREEPLLLGNGSYGSVFLVRKDGMDNWFLAMKAIDGTEDSSIGNLGEEINSQQLLSDSSKNVVKIVDIDSIPISLGDTDMISGEKNDFFIYMENLRPVIRKGPDKKSCLCPELKEMEDLSVSDEEHIFVPRAFFALAIQIGRALEAAHEKGILHRDIKLENILCSPFSGGYKLSDFGLAAQLEAGLYKSRNTRGTGIYMPPEIYYGANNIEYGFTTDIYSFGIVLYLLLNNMCLPGNNIPYDEETLDDLKSRYELEIIPDPENGSPKLKHIVARACDNDPKKRYQSMEELVNLLIETEDEMRENHWYYLASFPIEDEENEELFDYENTAVSVDAGDKAEKNNDKAEKNNDEAEKNNDEAEKNNDKDKLPGGLRARESGDKHIVPKPLLAPKS